MAYQAALEKAWADLEAASGSAQHTISLLGDTYEVNVKERKVFSNSCNIPAQDFLAVLLLHYLRGYSKNGYVPSGEWISFKDIEGGESYYPAFRQGVIGVLLRKYGNNPEGLFNILERFKAKKIDLPDVAVELETFAQVWIRIIIWKADEEFGPEASILFDKSLTKLYSMEDITVFSHFIVNSL